MYIIIIIKKTVCLTDTCCSEKCRGGSAKEIIKLPYWYLLQMETVVGGWVGGGVRWNALSKEQRSHQGIAESHYFWSVSWGSKILKLKVLLINALRTCLSVGEEHLDVQQVGNVGLEHCDARSIIFVCPLDGAPLLCPTNSHTHNWLSDS